MVDLVVGTKGNGKTKCMLDKANNSVNKINGSIVFMDRNYNHMYELDRNIRLIDTSNYFIYSPDAFIGFIEGVISQNKDIELFYIDGFLKLACIDLDESFDYAVESLEKISEKFNIKFVLSVSKEKDDIPESLKSKINIAL